MARNDQPAGGQKAKVATLSRGLSHFVSATASLGEQEPLPDAGCTPNSPDALDALLEKATDPRSIDELVDG